MSRKGKASATPPAPPAPSPAAAAAAQPPSRAASPTSRAEPPAVSAPAASAAAPTNPPANVPNELARSVTDLTDSTGGDSTPVGLTTLMCGSKEGAQAFRDTHPHWGYTRTGAGVGPPAGAGAAHLLGVTPGAHTPRTQFPGHSSFAPPSGPSSSSPPAAAAAAASPPRRGVTRKADNSIFQASPLRNISSPSTRARPTITNVFSTYSRAKAAPPKTWFFSTGQAGGSRRTASGLIRILITSVPEIIVYKKCIEDLNGVKDRGSADSAQANSAALNDDEEAAAASAMPAQADNAAALGEDACGGAGAGASSSLTNTVHMPRYCGKVVREMVEFVSDGASASAPAPHTMARQSSAAAAGGGQRTVYRCDDGHVNPEFAAAFRSSVQFRDLNRPAGANGVVPMSSYQALLFDDVLEPFLGVTAEEYAAIFDPPESVTGAGGSDAAMATFLEQAEARALALRTACVGREFTVRLDAECIIHFRRPNVPEPKLILHNADEVREALHTDVHCEWIEAAAVSHSTTSLNSDSDVEVIDMPTVAQPPQQVRSSAQPGIGSQMNPMAISSDSDPDSDSGECELFYNSDGEAMYPVARSGRSTILEVVMVEQTLPCPAQGDCGLFAVLVAWLCPVVNHATEFLRRLDRLLKIPLPPESSQPPGVPNTPVPLPRFESQRVIGEASFQQFLLEYRDAELSSNEASSLWLKHGPNPICPIRSIPRPQYVAASAFCAALARYMRGVLVRYRRSRPELMMSEMELEPGDSVERRLRALGMQFTYLSIPDIAVFASLIGSELSIFTRTWPLAGPVQENVSVCQPHAQWLSAHAAQGHAIPSIAILFIDSKRRRLAPPNHFEGIVYRAQHFLLSTAQRSSCSTAHEPSASAHVMPLPGDMCSDDESDASEFATEQPRVPDLMELNEADAQLLRELKLLLAEEHAMAALRSHDHSDSDSDESVNMVSASPANATPAPIPTGSSPRVILAPRRVVLSDDTPAAAAASIPSLSSAAPPVQPAAELPERSSPSGLPTEAKPKPKRRVFTPEEHAYMKSAAALGVSPRKECATRIAGIAHRFSRRLFCSPEQVHNWMRSKTTQPDNPDHEAWKQALTLEQEMALDSQLGQAATSPPLVVPCPAPSGLKQPQRRQFSAEELQVLRSKVVNEGLTGRRECAAELISLAAQFSERQHCDVATLTAWLKKNHRRAIVEADDGSLQRTEPAPQLTMRRFSAQEVAWLTEAKEAGFTCALAYEQVCAELVACFNRHSQSTLPCTVERIRTWLTESSRRQRGTSKAAKPESSDAQQSRASATHPGQVLLSLADVGIKVKPSEAQARQIHRGFLNTETATLKAEMAKGVDGTAAWAEVYARLAADFSAGGHPVPAHRIRKWFMNHKAESVRTRTLCTQWRDVPHRFTEHQRQLLLHAFASGVRGHPARSFKGSWMRLSEHFVKKEQEGGACSDARLRELSVDSVHAWFVEHGKSASDQTDVAPLLGRMVAPGSADANSRAGSRRFSKAEKQRMIAEYDRGTRHTPEFEGKWAEMSSLFSARFPCTPEGVRGWLRRYQQGVVCRPPPGFATVDPIGSASDSGPPAIGSFSDPSFPRHEGNAGGRNKRVDGANKRVNDGVFRNSTDIGDALHHLWETSGLTRFRNLRKALTADALSPAEAEAALERELGPPVNDETRSRCIRQYNEYMDPCTPLVMCAACGVYEFNLVSAPLRSHDLGVRRVNLTPSIPIVERLGLLRLTPEQVEQYHNIEPAYRKCFGVMQIVAQGIPQWYHLHSHLTSVDDAGKPIARLCSSCQEKVSQGKVPQFSLASGCDFGNPAALGLPDLSLLEIQLIACYRIFANLVKLVAPFGMGSDTRQTAFSGHTIVFPHDGPAVCATKLPDLTNIHQTVSVMFIGTKEQWTGNKHSLLNKFRGIFQVRPQVVLRWLQALKGVGNPLYKNIPIAASDDPCWRQMRSLSQEVLDRAQIADDPVTSSIENFASSDVARVRAGPAHNLGASANAMAAEAATQTTPATTGSGGLSSVFVSRPTDVISVADARGRSSATVPSAPTVDPSIRGRLEVLQSLHEAINGPALAHASHAAANSKAPVKVSLLSDVPLNEFTENDLLLNGSFPNLFFLGRTLPFTGSVSSAFRLKLLRQHDNRFARNHQLLFLLFNQLQRHTVARTVAARVRSAPGQIKEFHRMVEEPDFQRKLDVAIRQPDGDVADKLSRRVLPMIQIAGAKVPFSDAQRAQDLPKLIAYTMMFGQPSFFLTVSPSDLDQPLIIRLAAQSRADAPDKTQRQLTFPLPSLSERSRILADNPVAAAEVFHRLMETLLKTMVGLMPFRSHTDGQPRPASISLEGREQCLLGRPVAHFFVFESQGRGTLHTHGAIWSDLPPTLLEDIAEFPHLVRVVGNAIDQICTAALPQEVHDDATQRSAQHVPAKRGGLTLCSPPGHASMTEMEDELRDAIGAQPKNTVRVSVDPDSLDPTPYTQRWHELAASMQRHTKHMLTCRKGKAGKYGCRMSMPQAQHPLPTGPVELLASYDAKSKMTVLAADSVSPKLRVAPSRLDVIPPQDKRVLAWELHRPLESDKVVVSFCPPMTAALGCNTALYMLGNTMQAASILFYLLKYMTKNNAVPTNCLSAVHEAQRHIKLYPSVAANSGDPIRTAQHFMNRLLNNISAKTEMSAEMASAALVGMPSTMASHDTAFCFIRQAIAFVKDSLGSLGSQRNGGSADVDSSDELYGSEPANYEAAEASDSDDGESDEAPSRATPHSASARSNNADVIEPVHPFDSDEINVAAGVHCLDEAVRIHKDEDGKISAVPQYVHYHYRGEKLKDLCFYEYVAMISVEALPKPKSGAEGQSEELNEPIPSVPRTSHKTSSKGLVMPFEPDHPMSATHQQRVRAIQVVPILAGKPAPACPGPPPDAHSVLRGRLSEWHIAARKFAEYMLVLFVPWSPASQSSRAGPPMLLSFNSFCNQMRFYEQSADLHLQCRAECIVHISRGLRVNYATKKMLTMWRNRSVHRWGTRGVESDAPAPGANPDRDLQVDRSDRQDEDADRIAAIIEQLRDEARADLLEEQQSSRAMLLQEQDRLLQEQYASILQSVFLSESEVEMLHPPPPRDDADGVPRLAADGTAPVYGVDDSIQLHTSKHLDEIAERLKADSELQADQDATADSSQPDLDFGGVQVDTGGRAAGGDDAAAPIDLSDSEDVQLNAKQAAALDQCLKWLQDTLSHESDPVHHAAPQPLYMLVHGGAGVGKSTFARALVTKALVPSKTEGAADVSAVACAAPTGIAATLLMNGRTLHSLLGIQPFGEGSSRGNSSMRLQPMGAVALTAAQNRLRDSRILLIDEVSMVGGLMLGIIDSRLRDIKGGANANLPFGGMGIILMGDFFQLPAVGDTALPTAALTCDETNVAADRGKLLTSLAANGGRLFQSIVMHRLTEQMRVRQDDAEHTALVESFQRTDRSPVTDALIQRMQSMYLTHDDVLADSTWMEASIVVPTNKQRHYLLPLRVVHFARMKGLPVLRWRYAMPWLQQLSTAHAESMYNRYPALTGYFVKGAPAFITSNINPNKGLANGTAAVLHSLSWEDSAYVAEVALRVSQAQPGEVIDVNLPLTVNVEVPMSQLRISRWTCPANETLVAGRAVLPLSCSSDAFIKLGSGERVRFREFLFELAFVITFHKCQGRTMGKIVLDLNKQVGRSANVTYSGLYVGLSRVRSSRDIRLFPVIDLTVVGMRFRASGGPLDHLKLLKPNADLSVWFAGFSRFGTWSMALVKASVAAAAPSARRRKAQQATRNAREAGGLPDDSFAAINARELGEAPPSDTPAQKKARFLLQQRLGLIAAVVPSSAPTQSNSGQVMPLTLQQVAQAAATATAHASLQDAPLPTLIAPSAIAPSSTTDGAAPANTSSIPASDSGVCDMEID